MESNHPSMRITSFTARRLADRRYYQSWKTRWNRTISPAHRHSPSGVTSLLSKSIDPPPGLASQQIPQTSPCQGSGPSALDCPAKGQCVMVARGEIRTPDLELMRLARFLTAPLRITNVIPRGLEPLTLSLGKTCAIHCAMEPYCLGHRNSPDSR